MNTALIDDLLAFVQKQFYSGTACHDYCRDRRMLVYALSWPAHWLDQRGLKMPQKKYEALLYQRLNDIVKHGNKNVYRQYFPRYLLKALQDHFAWHGDELYFELKHIRNCLQGVEGLLKYSAASQYEQDHYTRILAQAHRIVKPRGRKKEVTQKQLSLF